jgi:hypothetical protein
MNSEPLSQWKPVDNNIYNYDKTGFIIGIIFVGIVITTSDGRDKIKLAQPGNRE